MHQLIRQVEKLGLVSIRASLEVKPKVILMPYKGVCFTITRSMVSLVNLMGEINATVDVHIAIWEVKLLICRVNRLTWRTLNFY